MGGCQCKTLNENFKEMVGNMSSSSEELKVHVARDSINWKAKSPHASISATSKMEHMMLG